MKTSSLFAAGFGALAVVTLTPSCQDSKAASEKATERPPENGAQFKKGEGLSLTDEMRKAIDLKVEDVSDEKVASSFTISLCAVGKHSATGWINPALAKTIRPGMELQLRGDSSSSSLQGTVERVESMPSGSLGDSELTIRTEAELIPGSALSAILRSAAGDATPAIPRSALLKTAEGTFVYTVNGKFFVRTPVTIGASNDDLVAINDGLYSGDQVVTSPVMSLWMAELQVLRGGKACTCGH